MNALAGMFTTLNEGDHEHGIDMGTSFRDLPDDWVCPQCGAVKEVFTLVE